MRPGGTPGLKGGKEVRGILLALHGSKDPSWSEVAEGYRRLLSEHFELVEVGYLEYNSPSLREALEALVSKGADSIVDRSGLTLRRTSPGPWASPADTRS
ncbi:MAG: CbiX/SirB N-terminal domain-containing protein [Nitrososphaeria archaeon]